MLASHWMKAGLVLLWVVATAIVLSQCSRLLAPETPPPEERTAEKEEGALTVWDRAAAREKDRKAHELKKARQRANYEKLEADLVAMAKTDIPAALDELAEAAAAYRRKMPDLTRLKKEERWEREAPVKAALARARALTADYHAADREAQKGREGPTLHSAAEGEALAKNIQPFKRAGEAEFAPFVKLLPPLYGKVPEDLLLKAIAAIGRAALPADAFDPCARDVSACPKPPPPPPPKPPVAPPPEPPRATAKGGVCVPHAARPRHLTVHARPDATARVIVRLARGQCGIVQTSMRAYPVRPGGIAWEKITIDGQTGWMRLGVLPNLYPRRPEFIDDDPFPFAEPRYRRRYRGSIYRAY